MGAEAAAEQGSRILYVELNPHCHQAYVLGVQGNLAGAYIQLGRMEEASRVLRDVYSGRLRLNGEENENTLISAHNYANSLIYLKRFKEAKSLYRKSMPVARRVLGEGHRLMLTMRWSYAEALYKDDGATLDNLREAITTLEETERTARRVLGGMHPFTVVIEDLLRRSRAALRAHGDVSSICEAVGAMAT